MPEFEDQDNDDFGKDEYKDEDDGNSDDDYNFDLLGDVKKTYETVANDNRGSRGRRTVTGASRKEKIQVDDFNTAALDDLLQNEDTKPQRSGTMIAPQQEDEWDPYGTNEANVYQDSQPAAIPDTQKQGGASSNIFGEDDNDMWGGNQTSQNQPVSKQEQKAALEDLLGDDIGANNNDASMPVQDNSNSDYNTLKNLYNTAAAAPTGGQNMGMGGQQPNYYNTSSMGGGYNDGGMGYGNNNYGGGGMGYGNTQPNNYNTGMGYGGAQPNSYNTSYGGGGYNDGGMGYNNSYANQYNTGYGGGAGYGQQPAGGSYGYGQQNTGYNTTAPGGTGQTDNFDPFA